MLQFCVVFSLELQTGWKKRALNFSGYRAPLIQPSVWRAAICVSGTDRLLVSPRPCRGHQKDEHGLRKLRKAPHDVMQVTSGVTTALHRLGPQACHLQAPGSKGFSRDLMARPGLRTLSLLDQSFQKTRGQGSNPGAIGGSGGRIR